MTKRIIIDIDDNGVHYDLDGFQGHDCYTLMERIEEDLRTQQGVHVKGKTTQRKAPTTTRGTRQGLRGGV